MAGLVIRFGQYKGTPITELPGNYLLFLSGEEKIGEPIKGAVAVELRRRQRLQLEAITSLLRGRWPTMRQDDANSFARDILRVARAANPLDGNIVKRESR
jgi:uncharacterized protein (DUF3820 family)